MQFLYAHKDKKKVSKVSAIQRNDKVELDALTAGSFCVLEMISCVSLTNLSLYIISLYWRRLEVTAF